MRPSDLILPAAAALSGCAAPPADLDALRARQERACAAVVAEHDGMGVDEVTAAWQRDTPDGTAVVSVSAPGSLHTCEIDAGLRVFEIQHPGR